jgi:dUTP pyrophosphatase
MNIEIKVLEKEFYTDWANTGEDHTHYLLPSYATPGSAAMDLRVIEDVTLIPGERKLLPTGLAIWIGSGIKHPSADMSIAGLILPRSGLGTKGLVLANTIGLIDEDYQGQLMISAWHRGESDKHCHKVGNDAIGYYWDEYHGLNKIELKAGDRIAQLLLIPVIKAKFQVVKEFSEKTQRGEGGLGSTGAKQ